MDVGHQTAASERVASRHGRRRRMVALLLVPFVFAVAACNPIDTIEDTFEDIFNLGDNEIASPEFIIQNGIKIMAAISAPDGFDGATITVRLRCAGGSTLTETITLHDTGQFATGETTFTDEGWSGIDCVISQEIVQGVESVRSVIQQLGGGDILKGQFFNL